MSVELPPLEEELAGRTRLGVLALSARYESKIGQIWDRIIEKGNSPETQAELNSYQYRFDCIRDHYNLLWALDTVDDTKSHPHDRKKAQWIIWENTVNKLVHTLIPSHPDARAHILMSPYDPAPKLPEINEREWFLSHVGGVLPDVLANLPTPDGVCMSAEEFMSKTVTREVPEL